jgi:DNA-binding FrmR family transcriptional regulator
MHFEGTGGEADMSGGPAREAVSQGRLALALSAVGAQGRQAARQRLLTARGHLDAVLRMLADDRYCIDILHQLSAVEGAITRARRDIIDGHLRGCVADAVTAGEIETWDVAEEVLAAVFGGTPPAPRTGHRACRDPARRAALEEVRAQCVPWRSSLSCPCPRYWPSWTPRPAG